MTIPDGNALINELIGKNWMLFLLAYNILSVIFPEAKWLKAIGDGFSRMFPVFRGNKKEDGA